MLRQLDPALVFERFLGYALVADFDEENRKHPEDALRFHCPRSKAEAEKRQRPQWSAKQCAGILALYADMVREAEREGQEPPLTLDQFLGELGEAYLNGEFDVGPETAPAANDNGQLPLPLVSEDPPPLPATTPVVSPAIPAGRPSAAGQMVTAELAPGGREIRGTTLAVYEVEGRWYCDLRSTDGEEFRGLAVGSCRLDVPDTSTQAAVQQTAADESPLPVAESHKLWIAKSQFRKVQEALALNAPMGNVAIEDAIYPYCRRATWRGSRLPTARTARTWMTFFAVSTRRATIAFSHVSRPVRTSKASTTSSMTGRSIGWKFAGEVDCDVDGSDALGPCVGL